MTEVQEALREPCLPFLIGGNRAGARPGEASDAGGLTWIEVAGDAARLKEWLGGADCPCGSCRATPRCDRDR